MRALLLAGVIALGLAQAAQANVTYTLTNQVYDVDTTSLGAKLNVSLVVTDAAVRRGTFSITGNSSGMQGANPIYTGNVADFISLTTNGETVTPNYLYVNGFSLSVGFAADGTVTLFQETYPGVTESASISGTTSISGGFGGDDLRCGGYSCTLISAQFAETGFAAVPEPASLALLGAGIVGVGMIRRRHLV